MLESKSYPNKKLNPPANVSAQEDVLTNNSTRNEKKIEWHEICFLMLLGVLFGVVDNLFVGYFIWQHFGFIIFVAISLISIPITSVFKYFSYKNLYRQKTEFISDLFCLEKCRNYITNPANTLKILFLIVSIVSALILYNIYYGALFIQILGLFRNEMGISSLTASYLTMSLVFSSIIPDAISYIKDQYGRISSIFSSVDNPIIKLFDDNPRQKIFLILFVILLSYIFAQIEFTQIINSYQHYLIEVLEVIIPIVANKMFLFALILITNFSILYGMACNFLQGIHAYAISIQEYISGESTQKITANNVLEFLMFFIIVTIRAIGRSLAAGQLAINPYNIDAKNIALFFSVIFDFSAYFGLRNKDGRAAEQQEDEREIMKYILYVITLAFTALIVLHVINVPVIYALLSLALGAGISEYYPPFIFSKILPSGDIKGGFDGNSWPETKPGANLTTTSSLEKDNLPGGRHGY